MVLGNIRMRQEIQWQYVLHLSGIVIFPSPGQITTIVRSKWRSVLLAALGNASMSVMVTPSRLWTILYKIYQNRWNYICLQVLSSVNLTYLQHQFFLGIVERNRNDCWFFWKISLGNIFWYKSRFLSTSIHEQICESFFSCIPFFSEALLWRLLFRYLLILSFSPRGFCPRALFLNLIFQPGLIRFSCLPIPPDLVSVSKYRFTSRYPQVMHKQFFKNI